MQKIRKMAEQWEKLALFIVSENNKHSKYTDLARKCIQKRETRVCWGIWGGGVDPVILIRHQT